MSQSRPITLQTGEPEPPAASGGVDWTVGLGAAGSLLALGLIAFLVARARARRMGPRERAFRAVASALGVGRSEREAVRRSMRHAFPGAAPVVGLVLPSAMARAEAVVNRSAAEHPPARGAPRP
ncbi:MAG: hypothetical protein FJ255_03285 [Phycisphaerae bacterium]|nr:hypothetical protein [Phycisphaerae bacterium]